MERSRNILAWLGAKQEEFILNDAKAHLKVTYETVEHFTRAVEAFISGDMETKREAIEKVRESERQADTLRSKMISKLSESLLLPPDREDLMHFVKSLDRIADWTNGAARILSFIEESLPTEVLNNISAATDLIFNSISKLKNAIDSIMGNNLKKALEDCEEVDKIETKADDQKRTLVESIIHSKLEPASLLLSYQLAEYLEGVTDRMEDASDFIKILTVKAR